MRCIAKLKMPHEGEKVRLSKSLLKSQFFLKYSVTFLKEEEDILTYVYIFSCLASTVRSVCLQVRYKHSVLRDRAI